MLPELHQVLTGPQFPEPVRVVTIRPVAEDAWEFGVVGLESQIFRQVVLTMDALAELRCTSPTPTYAAEPELLRLGVQAFALGIAYEFDPYFALSISRVDPLPHQLEAVYDHLVGLLLCLAEARPW